MPSIQTGQSAVLSMPKKASNSSSKNKEGNSSKWVQLDSVVIPPSLQVPKSVVRENGMVVFKVNKVRLFVRACVCVHHHVLKMRVSHDIIIDMDSSVCAILVFRCRMESCSLAKSGSVRIIEPCG